MSLRRFRAVFAAEFGHFFRRPLILILALIIVLTAFGLSSGQMSISSGDSSVGGTKAWITSEFAQTQMMTYLVLLYFSFFLAIAAGLTLLRDHETKADAVVLATPVTAAEYVWGRYLAVLSGFALLLLLQAGADAFWNHAVPNGAVNEIRGPFAAGSYFTPALMIGLPFLVFFGGVSLYVGERTRNAVLVYLLPVFALLFCGFFLWEWSPAWLDLRVNRLLMVLDPAGFRWLNETYLKVDRGVAFYNHAHVGYDGLFWLNRAWLLIGGLGAVFLTQRAVAASRRGAATARDRAAVRSAGAPGRGGAPAPTAVLAGAQAGAAGAIEDASVAGLAMRSGRPGFLEGALVVARVEARELLGHAGLYLFVLLILIQVLGNTLTAVGAFDTPLLITPGITAVAVANQTTFLLCLLLLFYTVESLERERANGFASVLYATPIRTGAFLLGKSLATSLIAVVVLAASLLGCAIALGVQGRVPFSFTPYVLVWGLLLVPTVLVWTTFVAALYAAVGNRYAAYGGGLAALAFTGYRLLSGKLSWAGNWPLWGAYRWSDLGFFEADRAALVLNRIMVVSAAVFFTIVAVRLFGRRGGDGVRTVHRLAPGALARTALGLLPAAAVPLGCCVALAVMVSQGTEGGAAKKAAKDYWAKNLKTYLDAPLPDVARADIALRVDPARHWIQSRGTLTLVNPLDTTLARIPVSGGFFWRHVAWTMNGDSTKPEDRSHLFVFTPPRPLAKGDSVVIGWSFDGRLPDGVSKNGSSNRDEFILPSGVVLTAFTPSFMPVLGFMEGVGETKDNKTERRTYARGYWKGITRAGYGATAWFPARIAVTGPAAYTLNSVGICTDNTVKDGWRTQVWQTDHPVKILNVVCGRWKERDGQGTRLFYDPSHPFNVAEMSATLDAARRWYSAWFLPYPWRELKLSEFPALAGYAQGFGTNITFSENIGFLTKNDEKRDATFLVTAHESAHQWWGNILTPANGPGADLLSEGMAHFSTMLLFEKMRGERARMEFAKGLEAHYADNRRPDDERAMYDIDESRDSDQTVLYDRGGWVFWMLYDYLGHDRALEAYRAFIRDWSVSRDHPALQDLIAALRPYAADPAAYDRFVKQWCEDRVVPEYRFEGAKKTRNGSGWLVTATLANLGTGAMPVEVAATAGDRWEKAKRGGETKPAVPNPGYREARETIVVGSGESKQVTIRCAFEPKQLVADPDVLILQLRRKQAVASL